MRLTLTITLDVDEHDPHAATGQPIVEQVKQDVLQLLQDIGYTRGATVQAHPTAAQFRATES